MDWVLYVLRALQPYASAWTKLWGHACCPILPIITSRYCAERGFCQSNSSHSVIHVIPKNVIPNYFLSTATDIRRINVDSNVS